MEGLGHWKKHSKRNLDNVAQCIVNTDGFFRNSSRHFKITFVKEYEFRFYTFQHDFICIPTFKVHLLIN